MRACRGRTQRSSHSGSDASRLPAVALTITSYVPASIARGAAARQSARARRARHRRTGRRVLRAFDAVRLTIVSDAACAIEHRQHDAARRAARAEQQDARALQRHAEILLDIAHEADAIGVVAVNAVRQSTRSVFTAPAAAARGDSVSASAWASSLNGTVTFMPRPPASMNARTCGTNASIGRAGARTRPARPFARRSARESTATCCDRSGCRSPRSGRGFGVLIVPTPRCAGRRRGAVVGVGCVRGGSGSGVAVQFGFGLRFGFAFGAQSSAASMISSSPSSPRRLPPASPPLVTAARRSHAADGTTPRR